MLLEHWGASADEIAEPMPGDALIEQPAFSATRSISLGRRPDDVFGWLAQMGTGRGGWYSYDLIDNFGRRSATELHPAWQVEAAGETIPAGPFHFLVDQLERPDHLVLTVVGRDSAGDVRALGHRVEFSLAYRLRPEGEGTRLVSRARASIGGPLGRPVAAALGVGDGVMVRRQLLGLRRRCS